MDSVTHIVFGAALGEVLLGKKTGNKAMLWGALAATVPDFDVVISWINSDPILQLQTHRAYTHSMFFQLLMAWLFAFISVKLGKKDVSFRQWYGFWYIGFFAHSLLDCCTTYGTRLLLPFTSYQVAFNNLSIIDPLYTLPILILLIVALCFRRSNKNRLRLIYAAGIVSMFYLVVTTTSKAIVHHKFKQNLEEKNIHFTELNSTPSIFNAILWSGIAFDDSTLYTAEYSLLRPEVPIEWSGYKRNLNLLDSFKSEGASTLKWFADGNYFLQQPHADTLLFFNTKWGKPRIDRTEVKDEFLFYYVLYKDGSNVNCTAVRGDFDFKESLNNLKQRIGI